MDNRILLLSMLCLLATDSVITAQIIIENSGSYEYHEESYNFKELKEVVSIDDAAYDQFLKARSSKRGLTTALVITGSAFVGGTVLLAANEAQDIFPTGELIGAVLLYSVGVVSGIITLFQLDNMIFRQKETITIFNENRAIGYKTPPESLKFAVTTYGVGLVYEF